MKRFLVIIVVALITSMSVSAQEGYSDTKHEVAVSFGTWSNSQWIDLYESIINIWVTLGSVSEHNEKLTGPISAEYFYHAKEWLGVGGIFVYGKSTSDTYLEHDNTKIGKSTNSYYTLMPAVKFDWLRKKNFGMYSKLAIGATLRSQKSESTDPAFKDETDSNIHVNWQLSALGIEGGLPKVRAFAELGFGEQGVILAGLRYKF